MAASTLGSVLTAALLLLPQPIFAEVPLDLCASFNTADSGRNVSIYQTNGLCSTFCRDEFAFAVTQDNACWCSNYKPSEGSQVDMGRCDIPCPAYPVERCGGRGLFGYVELNGRLPEGTRGPEEETESTTEASSEEPTEEPTSDTAQETTAEPTTTDDSDTTTDTDDGPMSTSMVQTITNDGGKVRTVTVMPTSEGTDPAEGTNDRASPQGGGDDDGGLGTGAIVGIVVGIIAAILIGAGAFLFWFFKRRKRNQQLGYQEDPSVRDNSSDRMGSSRPDMAMAHSNGGGSPISGVGSNSNRNSALAIDPRMDPFKQGLYMRNASQESINTLRDDHDYSRRIQAPKVLRATNPDPDGAR